MGVRFFACSIYANAHGWSLAKTRGGQRAGQLQDLAFEAWERKSIRQMQTTPKKPEI